ncbi:MAG: tRNA (N6-isopentenyl adenosine(37)-C2)-methylthiotransferase MiaB [Patescibacteria group bacterium]
MNDLDRGAEQSQKPKYFIRVYGCQMNANDAERMARILESAGFESASDEKSANLIILNTCSVRESAEQRIYGLMQKYLDAKRDGRDLLIAVTGCMAGRDKDGALQRRLKSVDLFFKTPEMVNLPRWIAELRPNWMISGGHMEDYLKIQPLRNAKYQAYVAIQTGCNQFCSYCVVPYARGLEKNRPCKDILREIREHADEGATEITLLGQSVNSYRASDTEAFQTSNPYQNHFAALLWEVNQIPQIERIHWTAAHPLKMDDQVIHALTLPKQINYLHLPVQSGSDDVLRRMNRKYTRDQYLGIVDKINYYRPGIALGTDIIVGFPGETSRDFEDTVSLYKLCNFDISYTAQYSERTGTLSHRIFTDDVPSEVKKERWQTLQNLMEEITYKKNQDFLGRVIPVYIENVAGQTAHGTSAEFKRITATRANPDQIGKTVPMKVTKAGTWMLEGEIVEQ